MSKSKIKFLSVFLCSALIVGSIGTTVYAKSEAKSNNIPKQEEILTSTSDSIEPEKDENVYVLTNSDGSLKKVIVSDWIKNSIATDGGLNLGDSKVWDNQGNKIKYKGDIKEDIPVDVTVSYTLDSKKISPEELAGKSGHVVIRFDYKNNVFKTVNIKGKKETINVPFAMLTNVILNDSTFRNVEVSNGKLVNDGTRTMVVGVAFPGMQENLNINKKDVDIPDYVEISADVTNFEMTTTITIATNEVFNEIDTNKLNDIDSLVNSMDDLKKATNDLIDGSNKLYDGLSTLLEKSNELSAGVDKLADGAKALKDGTVDLDKGATQLQTGANSLYTGLNTLVSNNDTLNGGAKQVFDTLLATATQQLNEKGLNVPALTIDNYADILNGIIAQFDHDAIYQKVLTEVTNGVEAKRPEITEKVTAIVKQNVSEQVTLAVNSTISEQVTAKVRETVAEKVIVKVTTELNMPMTKEEYEAAVKEGKIPEELQATINQTIDSQMISEEVKAQIEALVNAQMETEEVKALISSKIEEQMQSQAIKDTISENIENQIQKAIADIMASDDIKNKLNEASAAAQSVISLKTSLDSYGAFYNGLITYTNGVKAAAAGSQELKAGIDTLKEGSSKLNAGAVQLSDGVGKMKENTPALISGVTQLKDGSKKLSDGLKEFDKEGIQKLVDAVDGDIDGLTSRIRATVNVSKAYRSFPESDFNENANFIYRTDSIKNK